MGGTRGIGRAITQALAAQRVATCFAAICEAAGLVGKESTAAGWTVSVHQGEVGIPEDCSRVADEVFTRYGGLITSLTMRVWSVIVR
jgi:NAD(P)-dependent dehydrogenase (short-subunit alcohol dehydrogenase family)